MSNSVPFHVPITLSVHISLGVRYSPVSLIVPVTQYGISYFRFLLYRTDPHLSVRTFLYGKHLDPYIRGFRQSYFKHSDLGYFVDLRPIGSTVHLWTAFVGLVFLQQSIRLLSADFTELLTSHISVEMPVGVLRGRFRALPHHSTSRIVSSPNI